MVNGPHGQPMSRDSGPCLRLLHCSCTHLFSSRGSLERNAAEHSRGEMAAVFLRAAARATRSSALVRAILASRSPLSSSSCAASPTTAAPVPGTAPRRRGWRWRRGMRGGRGHAADVGGRGRPEAASSGCAWRSGARPRRSRGGPGRPRRVGGGAPRHRPRPQPRRPVQARARGLADRPAIALISSNRSSVLRGCRTIGRFRADLVHASVICSLYSLKLLGNVGDW